MDCITLDEGLDAWGTRKHIILEGDQAVTKLTYDAEPLIEAATAERHATSGERWGEGRKIGVIPMPELQRINAAYKSADERKHAILCWLRDNPKLVTFDKFLR